MKIQLYHNAVRGGDQLMLVSVLVVSGPDITTDYGLQIRNMNR